MVRFKSHGPALDFMVEGPANADIIASASRWRDRYDCGADDNHQVFTIEETRKMREQYLR